MKRLLCIAALATAPLFGEFCDKCYDEQFRDVWPELYQCQFYTLLDNVKEAWEEDDIQEANKKIGMLILLVNDNDD